MPYPHLFRCRVQHRIGFITSTVRRTTSVRFTEGKTATLLQFRWMQESFALVDLACTRALEEL